MVTPAVRAPVRLRWEVMFPWKCIQPIYRIFLIETFGNPIGNKEHYTLSEEGGTELECKGHSSIKVLLINFKYQISNIKAPRNNCEITNENFRQFPRSCGKLIWKFCIVGKVNFTQQIFVYSSQKEYPNRRSPNLAV